LKEQRQNAIVKIITENDIDTQESLLKYLNDSGFDTTQATVSRDIRELNITKVSYEGNRHKYVIDNSRLEQAAVKYRHMLENYIISIDHAGNLIVIRTTAGMAMAVGTAIDSLHDDDIMGCIAGDDTLFIAIRNPHRADEIIGSIKKCY